MADAFAAQLIAGLQKRDTDRYNAQRTYLSTRIDSLNNTVNGLRAQLAGDPTNQVIAAQLNAAANELGIAYSDFGNLTATGPPTSRLSVLEPAQAVPINQAEYDSRLNLGALGQNHLTGGVSADQPVISTTQSSGKLNGPVARGLLGALLGLFCGLGLAILLERLHRRIRAHEDAEEAFGLPVLAEVPKLAQLDSFQIVGHERASVPSRGGLSSGTVVDRLRTGRGSRPTARGWCPRRRRHHSLRARAR